MKLHGLQTVVKGIDRQNRTLTIMGTTGTKDRYGDVVEPKGGDLAYFQKNPVFLWAHDYSQPPIGKSIKEKVTSRGIEFTIQFADTAFAREIFTLYEGGFLNASSIGFMPKEFEPMEKGGGYRYTEWELLELSAVPIPANPDALSLAMKRGISSETLRQVFEEDELAALGPVKAADPEDSKQAALLEQIGTCLDDADDLMEQLRASVVADSEVEPNDPLDELMLAFIDELETKLDGVDETLEDIRKILDMDAGDEASKGALADKLKTKTVILTVVAKAGAVLNTKNKDRLKQASDLILSVLSSAEPPPDEEGKGADPPDPIPSPDEDPAAEKQAGFSMPSDEAPPNPAISDDQLRAVAQEIAAAVRAAVESSFLIPAHKEDSENGNDA